MSVMQHPQTDKRYLCECIRRYLLGCKRKYGTARSQTHYRDLVATYKTAKQENRL